VRRKRLRRVRGKDCNIGTGLKPVFTGFIENCENQ
jgi:hypothetical protein